MKAELYKRLFRAIFSEDIPSLKKIAGTIIQEERRLGHNVLADALENQSRCYLIQEKKKLDCLPCLKVSVQILNWSHIFLVNN